MFTIWDIMYFLDLTSFHFVDSVALLLNKYW